MLKKMKESWNPVSAVALLGVLSAYYFGITGTFWAVTGEFTRWGGHIMNTLGVDTAKYSYLKLIHFEGSPLSRIDGVMVVGMFLGAFIAALISDNIKLRLPTSKIRVAQAIGGGILAGFGARLAMGCNLAAFFTGIPQFSLHAWFFSFSTLIGTYIGSKIIKQPIFKTKIKLIRKNDATLNPLSDKKFKYEQVVFILTMLATILLIVYVHTNQEVFPLVMIFGLAFGFLLEKGQVCFTSALRDLWTVGRTNMTHAIIIGMMISTIGTFAFIKAGVPPKILWAGPNAVLGGLIFGIGIVIAGGCETGWMYRAVEGQVHYMLVGVGNIIGSILLVLSWDSIAQKLQ